MSGLVRIMPSKRTLDLHRPPIVIEGVEWSRYEDRHRTVRITLAAVNFPGEAPRPRTIRVVLRESRPRAPSLSSSPAESALARKPPAGCSTE